ncbi:PREDICTED: probable LRR receptor-like serine/threonine-protein kinase At1g53430 isoform X3 [Populus euphratica]|uniref:non-specific serine/threonine protein kinase n=1 Tax=Populus euphratica TaxID=75702 RepID=A0AAJ6V448_POPEU|nr:PREDICTED: probable LRR receptor-like serine/threonine-protein kinase At1g53430 isoform X3 [Populus euphratica]
MAKLYLKLFPKLVSSLVVLLLLCQCGHVACQSTDSSDSPQLRDDEAKALDELMTTLGWGFQQISRSACDNYFQGITCNCTYENRKVCHVTRLDLSNNQLYGSILVTMGNLPSLYYLDLSTNFLSGSIPSSLGDLSSLRYLDLSTNFLNGSIPPSLGNLPSLEYLYLSRNFLNGSIPSSLGNLPSLEYLILNYNMLSGQIPPELGNLSNLRLLALGFNELSGQLPPELGRLGSLGYLELGSNNLSGELPGNYSNFSSDQLVFFSVSGNRLTGQIPRFIANWTGLYFLSLCGNDFEGELPLEKILNLPILEYLFVSDVRSSGFPFPKNASMKEIRYLMIRNCSISGEIPPYIGDWSSLKYLDLSFNNLTGRIPDSMKNLNLTKMFLTRNMLSGTLPPWLPHKIEDKADLSYNDFEIPNDGPKKGEGKLNISEPNRNSILDLKNKCRGKPKYNSLYINCGGGETVVDGKVFEADSATLNYHLAGRKNWAYSCSGDFGSKTYDSSDYIKNVDCGVCDSAATQFNTPTRLCPLSLTYYGFCLFKGNYTVKLYFAETVYQTDEDYSNLGKRVFDVYIQGQRELKDFNIKEMAGGTNKAWTANFTAHVGDDHLLTIHFFWAGKGSFQVPGISYSSTAALSLNGPLVSGISVTANFKVGTGLSPSQIAGITAGSVFAPLLLLAFMWKMGWLRKSELDELTIEVQGKPFTLKQIIDATRKFSPKMEIGRGRFGIVYKAELPNKV